MFVRPAEPGDYQEWLSMRAALCPQEEYLTEMRDSTSGASLVAFVAGVEGSAES